MEVDYDIGLPRHHHRFNIQDGDIVLQVCLHIYDCINLKCDIKVNKALFRVHRHFLVEHSIILKDTLSLPRPQDTSSHSTGIDNHIQLSGDSVFGWECLLGLFYREYAPFQIYINIHFIDIPSETLVDS
jgi:hypothetical protein